MSELFNKKNEIKNKIYDLKNNTQINTFTKIKRLFKTVRLTPEQENKNKIGVIYNF